MAHLRGLLSFCILVLLVVQPHQAYGSGRGSFRRTRTDPMMSQANGICASSVIVHGYKCQEIYVTTKDGYILNMQRIPEGRIASGNMTKKQPVLIQHGVLVDGMTWLLNPPEQNLPLILADNGFDVWIANSRGTRFSRRHTSLDAAQSEYWNWSWDELVAYDMPTFFDYVHSQTGQKVNYVGHSLGTLIALASFSEGLQVDKLKSAALLSPIAYLSHMSTVLGVLAAKTFVGEISTIVLGLAEFNPKDPHVENFLKSVCANPGVDCYDLLSSLTGKNCCLNASTVDLFLKNGPQSTSTRNMIHLSQTVRDKVIAKFNYGRPDYNLMHYGAIIPPVYNISNIPHDLPIFVSYGGNDALSDVKDVQDLLDSFKFHDVDKLGVQFIKNYAHADFIMGINAKDIVYNQVLSFFKRQQ
ncbi:triacylglycerol lipase 2 isoform X2 [Pistacia vera]|uniref:triacylglycerol lipase 2 isoform X2 n=1 Tax=Pistacia vera TaxID=55513 RepID=UPI0012634145|nr:triacylglycerol lipase 2 isoform X2 [Pistacia vera]